MGRLRDDDVGFTLGDAFALLGIAAVVGILGALLVIAWRS